MKPLPKTERLVWSKAITACKRPLLVPSLISVAVWVAVLFVGWVIFG